MISLESLEEELRQRNIGWWERLCEAIPELVPLSGTVQPTEHHAEGDVATHTRLAVEACPDHGDPDLLWLSLLHDIGKPATTQINEEGRVTAYGHAKIGAEMAGKILDRIGMPRQRRERILWAVRHHGFYHAWQLHQAEDLSKRQRQYLLNPNFPLLLEFLRIDSLASQGNCGGLETYYFYRHLWESIEKPLPSGD